MRFRLNTTLVLAAALPWLAVGQGETSGSTSSSLATALAKVPPCALECLAQAVTNSSCSLTNETCICVSQYAAIEEAGTPCILKSCSLPEALFTKNLTETTCSRPRRDKAARYDAMNISLGVITACLVVVRLAFKRFFSQRQELGADDWAILATLAIGIPCTIINKVGLTAHGLGKDVWTLQPAEITDFVLFFYIMEVLYLAEMSIIKLSLSLFYLHIFPGTTTRRLLIGTAVFNVVFGLTFVTTAILQCTPVSYYWTQYVGSKSDGRCINLNIFAWINASLAVVVDIWMIAIPLIQIRKLELHWKKRIGVTVMFLTGTFVTVVSVLRLQSLIYFANSTNPTWDQWIVAWWSTIEVNVGMICTCLPTVRLILVRACPRVFSTNGSRSKSNMGYGNEYSRNSNYVGHKPIQLSSVETNLVEERETGPESNFGVFTKGHRPSQ